MAVCCRMRLTEEIIYANGNGYDWDGTHHESYINISERVVVIGLCLLVLVVSMILVNYVKNGGNGSGYAKVKVNDSDTEEEENPM
eukprot:UN08764